MDNPPPTSRDGRPPPKLKREVRIPILQIQKLQQPPPPPSNLEEGQKDEEVETSPLALSPVLTAPPQLEPVVHLQSNPHCPIDLSDHEDDTEETKLRPLTGLQPLGRRERRGSSVSETDQKNPTVVDKSSTKAKEAKRRSNEPPARKIIQSIFAKPKPQKPRRSRRGKGKSSPKKSKAPKGPGRSNILKIKIPCASSRRLRKEEEDKAAALSGSKDQEVEGEVEEVEVENVELVEDDHGAVDEVEIKVVDLSSDEEGSVSQDVTKEGLDEEIQIKEELDEDEDDVSKMSEDEDDLFDEIDHEGWKPVRAAMVAAMELVAKKQVTDDMRVERRVRKPYAKPLPPKGRGRRTIFKKMQKPIPSCQETEGPSVQSSMYFNGNYYQKGDIVYLLPSYVLDLDSSDESDSEVEADIRNFFQVRGFVRSGMFETCASVLHLKAKYGRSTESPFPFDPTMFTPDFGRGETMVKMEQLKIVLHCPIDLYHGHDLTYENLAPGSIYARLGTQFYSNQISKPPLPESDVLEIKVENGDASASSDSTTSQSIVTLE